MPDDLNPGTATPSDGGTSAEPTPAPSAEPQNAQGATSQNDGGAQEPKTAAQAVPSLIDGAEPKQEGNEPTDGAPESYEAFKGENGEEFTPDQVKGFAETAKELGLSQEKAQKMFGAMFPVASNYLRETHIKQVTDWRKAAETDREFGGTNLQANLGVAKVAYDRFASPELKQVLRASGLDNHPEMIRMFYHAGKALSQDAGVSGTAPAQTKHVRFPNSNMVEDT